MIPQSLLGSLSAHLPVPRSFPSSALSRFPTDRYPVCQRECEVFEEGTWRGVLIDDWYLLGRITDWEQAGQEGQDAASHIDWTRSRKVEPLFHSQASPTAIDEKTNGIESWQGTPKPRDGDEVEPTEPRWIVIHARSLRPVPYLIKHWGTPPDPVQEDWRRQTGTSETPLRSIWILSAPDGVLYRLEDSNGHASSRPTSTPKLLRETPLAVHPKNTGKRTKKKAVPRVGNPGLLAGALVAVAVLLGVMLWIGRDSTTEGPKHSESGGESGREAEFLAGTETLESPEVLVLLEDEPLAAQPVEPVLEAGGPLNVPPIELPVVDLAPFSTTARESSSRVGLETIEEGNEFAKLDDATNLDAESESELQATDSVTHGIRKTFLVSGGLARHRIGTGSSVVSTRATCLASLTLSDVSDSGITIHPSDSCLLVGESEQQWVVALEEEAPELVLALASRPARRWELFIKTGVREHRNAPTYWLHAGQANRVVDQMAVAKRSADGELSRIQSMLDSGQATGPFNLRQRRRQLQQLDKELERSIEVWKVVERLSLIVLDQAQLEVMLQSP